MNSHKQRPARLDAVRPDTPSAGAVCPGSGTRLQRPEDRFCPTTLRRCAGNLPLDLLLTHPTEMQRGDPGDPVPTIPGRIFSPRTIRQLPAPWRLADSLCFLGSQVQEEGTIRLRLARTVLETRRCRREAKPQARSAAGGSGPAAWYKTRRFLQLSTRGRSVRAYRRCEALRSRALTCHPSRRACTHTDSASTRTSTRPSSPTSQRTLPRLRQIPHLLR